MTVDISWRGRLALTVCEVMCARREGCEAVYLWWLKQEYMERTGGFDQSRRLVVGVDVGKYGRCLWR